MAEYRLTARRRKLIAMLAQKDGLYTNVEPRIRRPEMKAIEELMEIAALQRENMLGAEPGGPRIVYVMERDMARFRARATELGIDWQHE